jgi:Glycosyl hydrolase family 85
MTAVARATTQLHRSCACHVTELSLSMAGSRCDCKQQFSALLTLSVYEGKHALGCHWRTDTPRRPAAGGYGADALVQGAWGLRGYAFEFWQSLDLFIYFSHALVTIPTVMWTDAGHAHGVPVLGTFIAEWGEGKAACAELFASRGSAEAAARQLAAIARWHRFDGWLVRSTPALTTQCRLPETWIERHETCRSTVRSSVVLLFLHATAALSSTKRLSEQSFQTSSFACPNAAQASCRSTSRAAWRRGTCLTCCIFSSRCSARRGARDRRMPAPPPATPKFLVALCCGMMHATSKATWRTKAH